MNFPKFARNATALTVGATLFAAVSAGAYAVPTTFNVSTTVTASCTVTDAGPANLTPTYTQSTDSGTGDETVLNTFCSGTNPTVTFTDAGGNIDGDYEMNDGTNILHYQISNTPTCTGIPGDNNLGEDDAWPISSPAYDICAAVTVGGVNTTVPAGSYTDTVTYTIAP